MAFGSILFTTKGKMLQAKAQLGKPLTFTRLALGDGELNGQSSLELNRLKNQKLEIPISSLKLLKGGIASVGGTFNNQSLEVGFYWRELGLFATDPDLGEILYCYGNAGALAEYIPASGGSEIIEKSVKIETIIGDAKNVNALIDSSLIYTTVEDLKRHNEDASAHPCLVEQLNDLSSPYVIDENTDMPAKDRVKGKLYFKVTSRQSGGGGVVDNVKVSPNMGLKIL